MATFFIIDDEPLILTFLEEQILELGDHVCFNFRDPRHAFDKLDAVLPDAVITDLRMPLMFGTDVLRRFRDRYPSVVRVLMSGQKRPFVDNDLVQIFIGKPWLSSRISEVIQEIGVIRDSRSEVRACEQSRGS